MVCLRLRAHWIRWSLLCTTVAGCGGGGPTLVTVTGKVVDGGQPVAIQDYEQGGSCLEVEFFPLGEIDDSATYVYSAYCEQDGSFVLDGMDGNGIPVGNYRVAVRRLGETRSGRGDVWQGRFDGEKSPFVFDITDGEEIVIDVSKANPG
jgi:hypothetical protein